MDGSTALASFLRARRGQVKPADVGVASYGARRVPGLRREELAQLAGVSVAYYTRLEQGHSHEASPSVVDALARALGLTDDERAHLHDLARPSRARARRVRRQAAVRPGVRQLVDAVDVAAVVLGPRTEVLAWNAQGHQLLGWYLDVDAPDRAADPPNLTRMLFLDPHHRDLYPRWDVEAARAVASLRLLAGRDEDDRELTELVGELCVRSAEFSALWARHPVATCVSGTKQFRHPDVGELSLDFEALLLPDDSGQRILTYTAPPGTASRAALELLRTYRAGSWNLDGSNSPMS